MISLIINKAFFLFQQLMGNEENRFMHYFKVQKDLIFNKELTKGVKPTKGGQKQSGQKLPLLLHINHETLESKIRNSPIFNLDEMNSNNTKFKAKIINETFNLKKVESLTDDRKKAQSKKYPFCCIGLLEVQFQNKKGKGTAFLISPNSLLTCAHNLFLRDQNMKATKVTFTLNITEEISIIKENGKQFKNPETRGESFEILTWKIPNEYMDPENQDYPLFDFALLKLKTLNNLENKYGYFGLDSTWQKNANAATQLIIAGFPNQVKYQQNICNHLVEGRGQWTAVLSDALAPQNSQLFEICYRVYTSKGQSGSPIFYETKDKEIYMIGIHTCGSTVENRGILITPRVRETINGWIEQMKTIFDISNVEIGNKGMEDLMKALRTTSNTITELHLANNSIGPQGIKDLMSIKWSGLKYLSLENNILKRDGAQSLAHSSNGWVNLEVLNINNTMVQDEDCSLLLKNREWRKLKELHLRECNIGKLTFTEITQRSWEALELINLSLNSLKANDIRVLFEHLNKQESSSSAKRFPNLRILNLNRNPIGNEGVKIIANNYYELESLFLGKIGMNSEGMKILCSSSWPKLKRLYINENKEISSKVYLTPDRFPILSSLSMDGINLGAPGVKEFMAHPWINLKNLSVGYNFFEDKGLNQLRNYGRLEVLILQGNSITSDGVVEFAKKQEWKNLLQIKLGSGQIGKRGYSEIISRLTKLYYMDINSSLNATQKRELKELAYQKNPNLRLDIVKVEEANYN